MRAVASTEMKAVREYNHLQLSFWACSSVLFPLGRQYNSFLLYMLQNMEDNFLISFKIMLFSINLLAMSGCWHIWWSMLAAFINVLLVWLKHKTATKNLKMFSSSPFSYFMHEVPDTEYSAPSWKVAALYWRAGSQQWLNTFVTQLWEHLKSEFRWGYTKFGEQFVQPLTHLSHYKP